MSFSLFKNKIINYNGNVPLPDWTFHFNSEVYFKGFYCSLIHGRFS